MDNSVHFGFGEYLIFAWGLFVFFWMARAPKAILTLFGLRDETGRRFLVGCVRWFGRFAFFSLLSALLFAGVPNRLAQNPVYAILALPASIAISVWCLKRPQQEHQPQAVNPD
jgi:hypothetical protein